MKVKILPFIFLALPPLPAMPNMAAFTLCNKKTKRKRKRSRAEVRGW